MKKILLCMVLVAMIGCAKTEDASKEKVVKNENMKEFYQDVDNAVEKLGEGLNLPEGMAMCDGKYFENSEDFVASCDGLAKEPVCSFYYLTKNGEKKLKSLQYSNECFACKFYGKDGVIESGDMKYELIGLIKSSCDQVIYKK